jgi:Protein of unknown function (DUF1822)
MNLISSTMSNPETNAFSFRVPLTAANHEIAEKFYQQHSEPRKARQVYLNTLSVEAVDFYLTCLGIKTNLEKSQSWNPALQVLVDTADLWVNRLGHLECRPILMGMETCFVPAQVWNDALSPAGAVPIGDRIGYVVVQLNPDLTEAALLGFVPSVETESLPLEALQPIDELPAYLNHLASITGQPAPTLLRHWLYAAAETSWQTIETLMQLQQPPLAFSFRALTVAQSVERSATGAKRGKILALGKTLEEQVLLLLEITPTQTAAEYQIKMELYPTGGEVYLPRSLQIAVLDEAEKPALQAESNNSKGLEFQFSGEAGEQFSVKISLHDQDIIEIFEV